MRLWSEFLKGWFDGNAHDIRTNLSQKVPKAESITFQGSAISKGEGLTIHVTYDSAAVKPVRRFWSGEKWMFTEKARINFWIRAKVKDARGDGHNSQSLVRWGGDSLFAILSGINTTTALQRRGMSTFRPNRPAVISGGVYAMRQLSLNVTYTYPAEAAPELPIDAGALYQIKDGKLLLGDPDSGAWYGVTIFGVPPAIQIGLADVGSGSQCREQDGYLQFFNDDTQDWGCFLIYGDPPQFTTFSTTDLQPSGQPTYRLADREGFQVLNIDTGMFHTVGLLGTPAQIALSTAGSVAGFNYRIQNGILQYWDYPQESWLNTYLPAGRTELQLSLNFESETLEQDGYFQIEDGSSGNFKVIGAAGLNAQITLTPRFSLPVAVTPTYRKKDGVGIQFFNPDTGLWHALAVAGNPAQFVLAQDGEP